MKNFFLLALLLAGSLSVSAQTKFMTRTGTVNFVAEGPVKDDVKATNNQAACVLDGATGEVMFQIAIKSFVFKKALMQEHFNENYMESHKFPKAVLKGKVMDFAKIDLTKDGKYNVEIAGEMEMHGVKKQVREKGMLEVKGGKVILHSDFKVALADYSIAIPKIVEDKIAKEADVSLHMELAATAAK
ncbi:MAG: YceI family protein [Sphingobacteriaceae bacterium]|nr:YceI family protein [Sphingobacteriaceae bacterium]